MKLFRNPDIRKALIGWVILTVLFLVLEVACPTFYLVLLLGYGIILFLLFLWLTNRRYRDIAKLSEEVERILNGEQNWKLSNYQEGELAILENEITKMTLELKSQADNLKSEKTYLADSLADISHQLRTPLTSIELLLTMLQNSEVTIEERTEMLYKLRTFLKRIDWLVEALLKISKLDAGTAKLVRKEEKLLELVNRASEVLLISLELHEIKLVVDVEKEAVFTGDLVWTSEAVMNILKNCIEHTPAGGQITITGRENPLYTELVISDNGCGIDEEDLPHLFERFYRGKQAGETSVGIGLALARTIIVNQNGVISAKNAGGAEFSIRFYKSVI